MYCRTYAHEYIHAEYVAAFSFAMNTLQWNVRDMSHYVSCKYVCEYFIRSLS
jgi:hypothetical protein